MNEHTPVHKTNGDNVPLKDYIERLLDEREKAVALAYRNMEARLDRLNELRAEVQQDRGQFLRLDVYDEKHDALKKQVLEQEKSLTKLIDERFAQNAQRLFDLEKNNVRQESLEEQSREIARTRRALVYTVIGGLVLTGVNLLINLAQSGVKP